jgi:hypothetical protein
MHGVSCREGGMQHLREQDRLGGDERKVKAQIEECKDQDLRGGDFVKCMLSKSTWYSNALRDVGMIPKQKGA